MAPGNIVRVNHIQVLCNGTHGDLTVVDLTDFAQQKTFYEDPKEIVRNLSKVYRALVNNVRSLKHTVNCMITYRIL
jgi:hypothetical protein